MPVRVTLRDLDSEYLYPNVVYPLPQLYGFPLQATGASSFDEDCIQPPVSADSIEALMVPYPQLEDYSSFHQTGNEPRIVLAPPVLSPSERDIYLIKPSVEDDIELFAVDQHGDTAANYIACMLDHEKALSLLPEPHNYCHMPYTLNTMDPPNWSPLQAAIHNRSWGTVKSMLISGANPLHCPIFSGAGANKDGFGAAILHILPDTHPLRAFISGIVQAVGMFSRSHADVGACDVSCITWTALHLAAHTGEDSLLKELLEEGADPNILDGDKNSPLHIAIINGQVATAMLLLKYLDPTGQNIEGSTPLHLAVQLGKVGSTELVKVLLQRGADHMIYDSRGRSPLGLATPDMRATICALTLPMDMREYRRKLTPPKVPQSTQAV